MIKLKRFTETDSTNAQTSSKRVKQKTRLHLPKKIETCNASQADVDDDGNLFELVELPNHQTQRNAINNVSVIVAHATVSGDIAHSCRKPEKRIPTKSRISFCRFSEEAFKK